MFGKLFESTFTGSMFGAGADIFAVWSYVIAHTSGGTVELNPAMVGAVIGMKPAAVSEVIKYLCAPDPRSRSQEEDGRRIIHEGGFQYRVVNHFKYRAIKNSEERKEYNREAKRRERSRVKPKVNDGH